MRHFNLSIALMAGFNSSAILAADDQLPAPELTEVWQPEPVKVNPHPIPSDAIVLFDGTNTDQWKGKKGEVEWKLDKKAKSLTVVPGTKGITTKEKFCDMQLHIEWRSPALVDTTNHQRQGNSGVFIQGRYEIQVLNSYNNTTYANGQAGAIYKQSMPLVNASKPPLAWQTYDIIYRAPRFSDDGKIKEKAYVTVLHNGVLIQNHFEIQGSTTYRGAPSYKPHDCAPIYLQDHKDEVSYRNIWVRKL